jgi:hypothetical protein
VLVIDPEGPWPPLPPEDPDGDEGVVGPDVEEDFDGAAGPAPLGACFGGVGESEAEGAGSGGTSPLSVCAIAADRWAGVEPACAPPQPLRMSARVARASVAVRRRAMR